MTVTKALLIVLCSAMLGTLVGAGVGYLLGAFTPDFITVLFPRFEVGTSPIQVGLGLGTVNGGLVGIAVGTLVMGILSWRDVRLKQLEVQQKQI